MNVFRFEIISLTWVIYRDGHFQKEILNLILMYAFSNVFKKQKNLAI